MQNGNIMKKVIVPILVAAAIFFVPGCGPGQSFEIESRHTPQSVTSTIIAAAK
jgi:hypothetical protein